MHLVQATSAELIARDRRSIPADAVIFSSGLLGELAERDMIAEIPENTVNGDQFARRDIFDLIRQSEIAWGEQIYAVPLGSPVLTLLYRTDIFEAAGLQPPTTWKAYGESAEKLAVPGGAGGLIPGAGEPWRPVVEPLGDGWASQILLARAAGYARHRNYYSTLFDSQTMEPLIAGPPFVRALEELVAVNRLEPAKVLEYDPADARRELIAGRCAVAITWPSRADDSSETPDDSPLLPLAAAELPGSTEVFNLGERAWQTRENSDAGRVTLLDVAGRIGAVGSNARQPQAALALLLNLSSTEWSEQISPFSRATGLYRTSQLPEASSWLGRHFESDRDYGELVKQIQRRSLWLVSVRIPGRQRYLAALDEAVRRAVLGEARPDECLKDAADQWRAITDELGVEAQRAAYFRSLGMEP